MKNYKELHKIFKKIINVLLENETSFMPHTKRTKLHKLIEDSIK
jgi:hypothetical protein